MINGSRNYPEAVGLKYLISDLPDLPSKWIWTTLDELTYFTVDYRGRTPPKVEKGIPLISAAAIKHDKITVGISGYVTSEVYKQWITRGLPEPGDLVITTEAPVGESAIFPGDQTYLLSRRVFACKTNGVSNRYLMHILYSEVSRKHIRNHNRGSTVPRILKPDLLALPIPLPPLEEQKLIVEKIDAALTAKVNILEATKQDLGKDLSQLDRAILAKAFRGELVPQDPTDEPAAVLLERIRAERDKLNPQRQGKKTPARRKKASP
jgi:type I restriction enzyme S subunit